MLIVSQSMHLLNEDKISLSGRYCSNKLGVYGVLQRKVG